MNKIVILGLGGGGFAAALAIRRTDPEASITIIEKRSYDMYSPCGLPFAIEGIIGLEDLRFSLPADRNIKKLLKHEAQEIHTDERSVSVKNLTTGEILKIPYDALIIALGASPVIPPVKGVRESLNRGVFTLHDIESAQRIMDFSTRVKKAVIVDAGPIGLEIAVALAEKGLEVTVVEMMPTALPTALDKDMAKQVVKSLEKSGITFLMGKRVEAVSGSPVESVQVGNETIEAGLVILAAGVRANIDIAKNAGIDTGRWGIKTKPTMETSVKGIYAVGDCIEIISPVDHRPGIMRLSTSAYRQGMVAGTNAAGGYDTYDGGLNTFVSIIGNLEVAATGFNTFFAELAGYKTISGKAHGKTKPEYYPGARDIIVKILADKRTGRVIGGQAVGDGAAARINVLSLAVKACLDVYSLARTEIAYCPMVAENYDVLNKACDFVVRKLEKGD